MIALGRWVNEDASTSNCACRGKPVTEKRMYDAMELKTNGSLVPVVDLVSDSKSVQQITLVLSHCASHWTH